MIFDTHAHFEDSSFDEDREALLRGMASAGIGRIVNVGSTLRTTQESVRLSETYDFIYAAAGVHPNETGELNEDNFSIVSEALKQPKTVALGEIGLDYHWPEPDHDTQKLWFRRQLALAREKDIPVIIHSREAAQDTVEIMKELAQGMDAVIHCFSYSPEIADIFLKMGYYIGVGGVVTFKNAKKLKEVVRNMPLDRLLLETDCPYMAPTPLRGTRNDSRNLHYVTETIAGLRGITKEEVEEITWENACRFYRMRSDFDWKSVSKADQNRAPSLTYVRLEEQGKCMTL